MSRYPEFPLKEQTFVALSVRQDEMGGATPNRGYFVTTTNESGQQQSIRLTVENLRLLAKWVEDKGDTL